MDSKLRLIGRLVAVLAILGLVASCGPGYIEAGYGRIYLELNADGPRCGDGGCSGIADGVLEAWAMIDEVSVHIAGGGRWQVLSDTPVNVDLLRLPDHAADLGFGLIPAGRVTGIRLHVQVGSQSYVVEEGGSIVPMEIPSGMKSGILVKGKWNIGPCTENVIGLTSSDHHNAIHVHPVGKDNLYIFRPVIFAGEMITEEGECEEPGDNPGDGPGDNPELGGGDGEQECIPGDDAFPCPGGTTGHDDEDGDGSGNGSDVGTGDGTDVGTGDGTGDGVGGSNGSGNDDDFVNPEDGWNVNPDDMPGAGAGDGSGDDDGSGSGSDDLPCDPAVDDTCRP